MLTNGFIIIKEIINMKDALKACAFCFAMWALLVAASVAYSYVCPSSASYDVYEGNGTYVPSDVERAMAIE